MSQESVDAASVDFAATQPEDVAAVRRAFEEALGGARKALSGWTEGDLSSTWRLVSGSNTLMALPKGAMLRSIVCNHPYHHREQLTVYLRMLDVPLPSVYGPSADEQVFGGGSPAA